MTAMATREPPRLAARGRGFAALFSRELRTGVWMDDSDRSLEVKVRDAFRRLRALGVELEDAEIARFVREAISWSNGSRVVDLDTASVELARRLS